MTLGERIRNRREELQMSQAELAQKLGFKSRSSVNKIEMDIQAPRQKLIKDLANALETTVGYILGIEEEQEQQNRELCDLFSTCHGEDAYRVVQKFLKLDTSDRNVTETMVDSLLTAPKYKEEPASSTVKGA